MIKLLCWAHCAHSWRQLPRRRPRGHLSTPRVPTTPLWAAGLIRNTAPADDATVGGGQGFVARAGAGPRGLDDWGRFGANVANYEVDGIDVLDVFGKYVNGSLTIYWFVKSNAAFPARRCALSALPGRTPTTVYQVTGGIHACTVGVEWGKRPWVGAHARLVGGPRSTDRFVRIVGCKGRRFDAIVSNMFRNPGLQLLDWI